MLNILQVVGCLKWDFKQNVYHTPIPHITREYCLKSPSSKLIYLYILNIFFVVFIKKDYRRKTNFNIISECRCVCYKIFKICVKKAHNKIKKCLHICLSIGLISYIHKQLNWCPLLPLP